MLYEFEEIWKIGVRRTMIGRERNEGVREGEKESGRERERKLGRGKFKRDGSRIDRNEVSSGEGERVRRENRWEITSMN